ncbi:DMT family transporter [Pseudonocardia hispaniensis]|uniref:DMT family transporter n=1 Tax=Pseudonocardia hispaniensis TaxID=904933 RepID=A0ABW1J347_9PSEU
MSGHSHTLVLAVLVALTSVLCYATSAVLQQRTASRQTAGGVLLVLRLAREPRWLLAVAATVGGALLHVGALALGPLTIVQPLGVLTLVFALPLGARLAGRVVTPGEWRAAAAVVLGLAAVLSVTPHRAPLLRLTPATLVAAGTVVTALVVVLVVIGGRLRGSGGLVVRAAAAATCYGFASGMARTAITGAGSMLVAGVMATVGAAAGLGLAQLAYRDGGLGAPLATVTLVDPLVAVLIGVVLLGEPIGLTPLRLTLGVGGVLLTSIGIWALTRVPPQARSVPARR